MFVEVILCMRLELHGHTSLATNVKILLFYYILLYLAF